MLGSHLQARADHMGAHVLEFHSAKQLQFQSKDIMMLGNTNSKVQVLGAFTYWWCRSWCVTSEGTHVSAHGTIHTWLHIAVKLDEIMTRQQAKGCFIIMSTQLLQMCDASCAFMVIEPPSAQCLVALSCLQPQIWKDTRTTCLHAYAVWSRTCMMFQSGPACAYLPDAPHMRV